MLAGLLGGRIVVRLRGRGLAAPGLRGRGLAAPGVRARELAAPRLRSALAAVCTAAVARPAAAPASAFEPVAGSPFDTGSFQPGAVVFRPDGTLLAALGSTDHTKATVATFTFDPATGSLSPAGSVTLAHGPDSAMPSFSPDGRWLVMPDWTEESVSVFRVASDGALTQATGSPFAVGGHADSVAFSPEGDVLAVGQDGWADRSGMAISLYRFDSATGALTSLSRTALPDPSLPGSLAFTPDGVHLLAADVNDDRIFVFALGHGGPEPVDGSPFAVPSLRRDGCYSGACAEPEGLVVSPDGSVAATANLADDSVALFHIDAATGVLRPIDGAPVATSAAPSTTTRPAWLAFSPSADVLVAGDVYGLISPISMDGGPPALSEGSPFDVAGPLSGPLAFAPHGRFLAIPASDYEHGGLVVLTASPPTAAILSPEGGRTYRRGERVPTRFACRRDALGAAIASCTDSNAASDGTGALDTSTPGDHTYGVTATDGDGATGRATIAYTVAADPSTPPQPTAARSAASPLRLAVWRTTGRSLATSSYACPGHVAATLAVRATRGSALTISASRNRRVIAVRHLRASGRRTPVALCLTPRALRSLRDRHARPAAFTALARVTAHTAQARSTRHVVVHFRRHTRPASGRH